MQNRFNLLFIILFSFSSFSQQKMGCLIGFVSSDSEFLSAATIQINDVNKYALTNEKGQYEILKIPYGTYVVEVSFVGYDPILRNVVVNKPSIKVNFLLESLNNLEEVLVMAKSQERIKNEAPIKVELINVKKIQNRAVSLINTINQTAGIKVRESNRTGNYEVNINGLQGSAIRYFKNGIPTDHLGRAFQLNLIPTSNIANVEVYKGMLPANLGADALGGALNITTNNNSKNYLTTSYELGSFSKHSGTLNLNYCIPKSKFHIGLNSYVVSSKNNYIIDAPTRDYETQKLEIIPLERFHNGLNTQLVQVNLGIHNATFADIFDVEFSFFNYANELQNGYNIENVFGEVEEFERSKMFAISYKKKFINKLFVDLFYAHTNKNQKFIDVSDNAYDWFGNITNSDQPNKTRGELTSLKIDQDVDEKINTGRFYTKYKFSNNLNLKLATTYSSKYKVGTDPYSMRELKTNIQPITLPSTYVKIVSSIGLGVKLLNKKIHNEFVVKSFAMDSETISLWRFSKSATQSHNSFGFGNALKYKFDKNSFVRCSFEKATRIPQSEEYFGDNLFTFPNPKLRPEKSQNYNLGFRSNLDSNEKFFIDMNFFYRQTDDFIRKVVVGLNLVHRNIDSQLTKGVETTLTANMFNGLKSKLSVTYQDLRMVNTITAIGGSRTPNIPYFFSNFNISKKFESFFELPLSLDIYTNYSFTEQYLLLPINNQIEPKLFQRINTVNKLIIPSQHQFDVGITTKHNQFPITLSFQVNNILNLKLYDQFKIQKPTRNFNTKITYKF